MSRFSFKNQMTNENLSIVFGPTLMRSITTEAAVAIKNASKELKITEFLIANYFNIFDKK